MHSVEYNFVKRGAKLSPSGGDTATKLPGDFRYLSHFGTLNPIRVA